MSCGTRDYATGTIADWKNHWDARTDNGLFADLVNWEFNCRDDSNRDPDTPLICTTDADPASQGCSDCDNGKGYNVDLRQPTLGSRCLGGDGPENNDFYVKPQEFNKYVMGYHLATKARIVDLAGAQYADSIWPHFYHWFNHPNGKLQVNKYLADNPGLPAAAVTALKNNFTEDVQRKYGLLNGYGWAGQLGADYGFFQHRDFTLDEMKEKFLRLTVDETEFKNPKGWYGNPMWKHAEKQEAFRQVLGSDFVGDGADFVDKWAQAYVNGALVDQPGRSADDYFDPKKHAGTKNWTTDPDYAGMLPYVPDNQVMAEPWHRDTSDPKFAKADGACLSKESTQAIVPIVAGAICGGVAAMIVPGKYARIIAGGSVATAAYLEVHAIYGLDALLSFVQGKSGEAKDQAALILSLGVPAAIAESIWEIGILPPKFVTPAVHYGGLVAAMGVGYLVAYPIVEPIFNVAGDALTVLSAPLDVFTSIVHFFTSGCAAQSIVFDATCRCDNATQKPALASAIVEDVLGTTEKQAEMRTQCMQAAMTTGSWGADPVHMGTCDGSGHLSNLAGCVTAGQWARGNFDSSAATQADTMRTEISHCMDASNASMLPPTTADGPCVQQYGKYARAGGIQLVGGTKRPGTEGKCYDFRAPQGKQDMANPFDWSKVPQPTGDGECTIL